MVPSGPMVGVFLFVMALTFVEQSSTKVTILLSVWSIWNRCRSWCFSLLLHTKCIIKHAQILQKLDCASKWYDHPYWASSCISEIGHLTLVPNSMKLCKRAVTVIAIRRATGPTTSNNKDVPDHNIQSLHLPWQRIIKELSVLLSVYTNDCALLVVEAYWECDTILVSASGPQIPWHPSLSKTQVNSFPICRCISSMNTSNRVLAVYTQN